jgi:hypothetical protein
VIGRVLAAVVLALAAVAGAAAPTAHLRLEPASAPIGTPVRLVLSVDAPPGVQVVLPDAPVAAEHVDMGPAPATAGRAWTVRAWEPGAHRIAVPPVRWTAADGSAGSVDVEPVTLDVPSVLGDARGAEALRDVKPPVAFPPAWRPWAVGALVLALLVAAGVAVRRRRARRTAPAVPPTPPPPAHEVALAALDALAARRLPEAGAFAEFYAALSGIVRTYLEGRFALRAPEMTTDEFLAAAGRTATLRPDDRAALGAFLHEADLVKFARHVPAVADAGRAFDAARRFVVDTADRLAEDPRAAG